MAWLNSDGLLVEFDKELAVPGKAGHYVTDGPQRMLEVRLTDLTTLVDDPTTLVDGMAQGIVDRHNVIPTGAMIEKIEVITKAAATSAGSARLMVGVVDQDFASNDDDDALIATALYDVYGTIGNVVTYTQGSTAHGALVGTVTTKPLYVTASYETAVFTAGALDIRIFYSM